VFGYDYQLQSSGTTDWFMRATSASEGAIGHALGPSGVPCTLPEQTLRRLRASLKKQWKCYRKALRRCQKAFSEGAVHESRVETRRLLSLAELLSPFLAPGRLDGIRACVKRHLDTFDELRDTQVQLLAVKGSWRRFPAAERYYKYLRKQEKRLTVKTRKNIERIRTKRLSKLIDACRAETRQSLSQTTDARQNSKVLRTVEAAFAHTLRLKDSIDPADARTIHCTRVAFKQFRYMAEALAGLLPLVDKGQLSAMHEYQTLMGEVQDAEVLLQNFDEFARKKGQDSQQALRFRRELSYRRKQRIDRYLKKADRLLDFWPLPNLKAVPKRPIPPLGNGSLEGSQLSPPAQARSRRGAVP
jgi:CHAD domain-containing protein